MEKVREAQGAPEWCSVVRSELLGQENRKPSRWEFQRLSWKHSKDGDC